MKCPLERADGTSRIFRIRRSAVCASGEAAQPRHLVQSQILLETQTEHETVGAGQAGERAGQAGAPVAVRVQWLPGRVPDIEGDRQQHGFERLEMPFEGAEQPALARGQGRLDALDTRADLLVREPIEARAKSQKSFIERRAVLVHVAKYLPVRLAFPLESVTALGVRRDCALGSNRSRNAVLFRIK